MISSSQQFLPPYPVFSCSCECHILSFHQVTQHVYSFPTSCSLRLILPSIILYHAVLIHILPHAPMTRLHFPTASSFSFISSLLTLSTKLNHAYEYKHSLTFLIQRYVVIATKPRAPIANPPNSAQLEGTPTIPPTYILVRAVVWECGEGQTNRHTDGRGQ